MLPNYAQLNPVRLGPPAPTLFERDWPEAEPAAGRGVLGAALAAAVIGAASLPPDRPGLGWLVTGLGLVAPLAVVLDRARPRGRSGLGRIEAALWSLATLALLAVGFFRAAEWLFTLCVLTAFGCLATAVGLHRRVPALILAPFVLILAAVRALPWAQTGVIKANNIIKSSKSVKSERSDTLRLLAAIALALVLLLVFGALFASADAAFGRIVDAVVPEIDAGTVTRWTFVGLTVAALSLGGSYLAANPSKLADAPPRGGRTVRRIEWLVPVGAVLLCFVLFVAVQLAVLFGDRDYVMRTAGLTFAEYARKGFWQLLVVTVLALCVMAVAARKAPRDTGADRALLRLVLGALAVCSLVVVASALKRMNVYEDAYGFTRLRLFVSAVELWLGALFLLVMAAGLGGLQKPVTWLARAAAALWVLTLLGLAVLNPDRMIAAHNVDDRSPDLGYLRTLSADAAPELARLPEGKRECALSDIADDLTQRPDDWRGWNLARERARQIVPGRYGCRY